MTQALYAHVNNKRKKKTRRTCGKIPQYISDVRQHNPSFRQNLLYSVFPYLQVVSKIIFYLSRNYETRFMLIQFFSFCFFVLFCFVF
jgi:ABC-type transport system involved in Fe-S cluster assembly fused permease/ATPase subunit